MVHFTVFKMKNSKPLVALAVCIAISLHITCAQTQMIKAELPEPNVEVGSAAYFYCTGPDNTRWYKQQASGVDKEIVSSDRIIVSHVISEGITYANLTIGEVVKNDSGVYVCKDNNENSFDVQLVVYEVRDVVISPELPEFVEGENLLLNCTVDGTTDQTVTWSVNKAGTPEPLTGGDDTSHVQVFNNGSLIIRTLTPEDAGVYICTHEFDESSKSAMVNVGGEITLTADKSVKYTEGDRALIECEAHVITAALLPKVTWLMEGSPIEDACPKRCIIKNTTTTHTVTSKLEIVDITKDDRKNFTCIATNAAEGVSADILLRVRDRLAALWPFLGIVTEVVILIIIIFIHEKCSKGEDYGEDDEDDDDPKKEKQPVNDGDSDMRMRASKE